MTTPTPTEEKKCKGCNAPFEAHHHIHTTREGSYHTSCYKKLDHPVPAREEWEESWMTEEVECLWGTDAFKKVMRGTTPVLQAWMRSAIAHLAHNFSDRKVATLLSQLEAEIAEIIVDTEGLSKFPIGSVELHTTIGGNAGTRRAIEIIRSYKGK